MATTSAARLEAEARGRLKNLAVSDVVTEVLTALEPEGAQKFVGEMLDALAEAKENDDVTPINDVITSWYRTMLFAQKASFPEAIETARDPKRKKRPRSLQDVLKRQEG